jgi:hypothetical protein
VLNNMLYPVSELHSVVHLQDEKCYSAVVEIDRGAGHVINAQWSGSQPTEETCSTTQSLAHAISSHVPQPSTDVLW